MAHCESCKNIDESDMCLKCKKGSNFEEVRLTNADRIRAMSDEEMADFLYGTGHYWDDGECIVRFGEENMHDSKEDILQWLQSEVGENTWRD